MTFAEVFDEALGRNPILDDVHAFLTRFVSCQSSHAYVAHTLWCAHTHVVNKFRTSPRLAFLSPEPESGKTRGLEASELLVAKPEMFLDPSVAVIFRLAEQEQPTFLLDEVDNIFTKHGKDDENAELRGLLNNGYRKGATVPRCVGQSHEIRRFPVYAPVAFAGLGDFPAVLMSRCIVIRMRPA